MVFELAYLESLKRKQLQNLAKKYQVKANGKSNLIIQALLKLGITKDVDKLQHQTPIKQNVSKKTMIQNSDDSCFSINSDKKDKSLTKKEKKKDGKLIVQSTHSTPIRNNLLISTKECHSSSSLKNQRKTIEKNTIVDQQKQQQDQLTEETMEKIQHPNLDRPIIQKNNRRQPSKKNLRILAKTPPSIIKRKLRSSTVKKRRLEEDDEDKCDKENLSNLSTNLKKFKKESCNGKVKQSNKNNKIRSQFDKAHQNLFSKQKSIVEHVNQSSKKSKTYSITTPNVPIKKRKIDKPPPFRIMSSEPTNKVRTQQSQNSSLFNSGTASQLSTSSSRISVANRSTKASIRARKQPVRVLKTNKPKPKIKKFDLQASLSKRPTWEMKKGPI